MAVSNIVTHTITVYDVCTGDVVRSFGGRGDDPRRMKFPWKLCLAPNGNILVAEYGNNRVQEFTLAGNHVRFIGVGVINAAFHGIACNCDTIVVTKYSHPGHRQVLMFEYVSGALLRSFGDYGRAEGQLSCGIGGVRFTPDNRHIIIAEQYNNRLSLFTVEGAFVKCIGVGAGLNCPADVEFAPNSDIIVASRGDHRIVMFSADGSTVLRSFGDEGSGPGQFKYPTALAMQSGQLFVLDRDNTRVQVFC